MTKIFFIKFVLRVRRTINIGKLLSNNFHHFRMGFGEVKIVKNNRKSYSMPFSHQSVLIFLSHYFFLIAIILKKNSFQMY
jgi:hypothetical protein